MEILTIFNYPPKNKNLIFLRMFIHQHSMLNEPLHKLKVLSFGKQPKTVKRWHKLYKFEWIKIDKRRNYQTSVIDLIKIKILKNKEIYRKEKIKNKLLNHHNVQFKMWNLTKWGSAFIFLDVDAILFKPVVEILPYLSDKPFIAINHQNINYHTQNRVPFLNGGVQIVSKPGTFTYEMFTENVDPLFCPGAEQALMYTTFKNLNYDYTHPNIGYEWNSCSAYNQVVKQEDGAWKCFSRGYLENDPNQKSDSIPPGFEIAVNHYWDEFKPWKVNCPMYEEFRQIVISEETLWDKFLKRFYRETY